jgi:hypothetical protein
LEEVIPILKSFEARLHSIVHHTSNPNTKLAFECLLADLRGLVIASKEVNAVSGSFTCVVQWLNQHQILALCFPLAQRSNLSNHILQLIQELVTHTRGSPFSPHSCDGIVLFHNIAAVIQPFMKEIIQIKSPVAEEVLYDSFLKGIGYVFGIMTRTYKGDYVQVGGMEAFGDRRSQNCLELSLSIMQNSNIFPFEQVMAHADVCKPTLEWLALLMEEQLSSIMKLEPSFIDLIFTTFNHQVLNKDESLATIGLDFFVNFALRIHRQRTRKRPNESLSMLQNHVHSERSDPFVCCMDSLLTTYLFERENRNHSWETKLTKFIISLPDHFRSCLSRVAQNRSVEEQPAIQQSFQDILNNIPADISKTSIVEFNRHLQSLRKIVEESGAHPSMQA